MELTEDKESLVRCVQRVVIVNILFVDLFIMSLVQVLRHGFAEERNYAKSLDLERVVALIPS